MLISSWCADAAALSPMQTYWVTAPATFSTARSANVYMSSHRTRTFSSYSEVLARSHGIPVIDLYQVTQSRWESSYDGLHYAPTHQYEDDYSSDVSMMEFQVTLNAVFRDCKAPVASTKSAKVFQKHP